MGARDRLHRGYSLIELLVTLVLVALLIGVLLPALQGARASARKAQCLAQQSNNGRSLLVHMVDRDHQFPPMFHAFSPGQSGRILLEVVPRSAKEAGVDRMDRQNLVCPSDHERATVPVRRAGAVHDEVMSYGYNIELPLNDARLNELSRPSHTAVFFDGRMSGLASGPTLEGEYADSHSFVHAARRRRHADAVNLVFADWHARTAEQIEPEQVLLP